MNNGDNLGFASSEQIDALSKLMQEVQALMSQEEKLISEVLQGEEKIGKKRLSYLKIYFDTYSKRLDKIAEEQESLSRALLAYQRGSGQNQDGTGGQRRHKPAQTGNRHAQGKTDDKTFLSLTEAAKELREAAKALKYGGTSGGAVGGGSRKGRGKSGASGTSSVGGGTSEESLVPVKTFSDDSGRGALPEVSTTGIDAAREQAIEYINKLTEENARAQAEIDLARSEESVDIERRISSLRLETTKKELEATKKRSELEQQIILAKNAHNDSGEIRARQIQAEAEKQVMEDIATEMAALRAQKELEALTANNGATLEQNLARIEQEIAAETELRLAMVQEEAEERKKLDALKKVDPEGAARLEAAKVQYIAKLEYEAKRKNGNKLDAEEQKRIRKQANEKFKLDDNNQKRLEKEKEKREKEKAKAGAVEGDRQTTELIKPLSKENNLLSRISDVKDYIAQFSDGDKTKAALATATKALSSMLQQLESSIDSIAKYQGGIDTRLQGSNNKKFMGSHWNQLTRDMMSVGAVTPFFKQETFANNIKSLVEKGISFDLKQRAFLMTIQEKIATTFEVADGTLLRLIRLQQEDSTAGRLGMESALNTFLNNMYETSEYLSDVAKSVRTSLEEMEALMGGAMATEVEYQVQKWMGSLYSVGMSSGSVSNIANALGQLASGQIEGLSGGGAGNLLVMAAGNAGISITDMLAEGLDAEKTNQLLQATVNYLAEIAESAEGNNVVQQQLANVFGVKASDLRAATNLASNESTMGSIVGSYKTYENLLKQLSNMAGTMYKRTSIGEMMTNIWENGQYTIASSMANNPISYLLYKMAGLLEDTTGGISLPFLNVMGFGVDLETTVADLMRVASVGTGILGSIGPMIQGLASSFSGKAMLRTMDIGLGNGLTITPRGVESTGAGGGLTGGGDTTTSGSGTVGNGNGEDMKNATIQGADDDKKKQMIEAKEEEPANQVDMLNTYVLKIYELLDDVASGSKSLNVRVAGYGLIGGNKNKGNSVDDLAGGTPGGISTDEQTNSAQQSGSSFSLGGWTLT